MCKCKKPPGRAMFASGTDAVCLSNACICVKTNKQKLFDIFFFFEVAQLSETWTSITENHTILKYRLIDKPEKLVKGPNALRKGHRQHSLS